jgi:hypothetical protein
MAFSVMLLDVLKLRRVLEGRVVPVQVPHPLVQGRIPAADVTDVALEVLDVDGVEADQRCEEAHIGFGYVRCGEEVRCRGLRQGFLESVERVEEGCDVFRVRFLGAVGCQCVGLPRSGERGKAAYVANPDL